MSAAVAAVLRHSGGVLLAGALATTPDAAVPAEPSLIGIWYSAYQPDEPNVMSLIEFRADGTFYEEFRKCKAGDYVGYQFQMGSWSVEHGIERTVTETINGHRAHIEDRYTIEILTDTRRRVRLEPQGYEFDEHRVARFEFPDCPTGT